jgi:hypothetical protein
MTARDYVALARAVEPLAQAALAGDLNNYAASTIIELMVESISAELEAENPRFHESVFRRACGLPPRVPDEDWLDT